MQTFALGSMRTGLKNTDLPALSIREQSSGDLQDLYYAFLTKDTVK